MGGRGLARVAKIGGDKGDWLGKRRNRNLEDMTGQGNRLGKEERLGVLIRIGTLI